MNKQQLVVVLLVVAIILSAFNLMVSLGVDFTSVGGAGSTTIINQGDAGAGQVSFNILPNNGGNTS